MISLYEYTDYRAFLRARMNEMPKRGYGQANKLAHHLDVHTSLVSQVLRGHKSFTLEQAASTADFFEFTDPEIEFFLLLVQWDRAGNASLKDKIRIQLEKLKKQARELGHRLKSEKKLSEEARAIYYSDWIYAAVMQMTAIPGQNNLDAIAEACSITKKRAKEVTDFLIHEGLCRNSRDGLEIVTANLHLESTSPWVHFHHFNWRHKAMEQISARDPNALHFSAPLTLSQKDALKLRAMIVDFLVQTEKLIEPSPTEELHCLNIDWFRVGKNRGD